MTLHVLFTPDGIPGWIGNQPREGSEVMPETVKVGKADVACDVPFLAAYLRDPATGKWSKRPKPPAPTAEERAAERLRLQEQRRADRQEARRLARDAARRERLFDRLVDVAARLDPDFAKAVADLESEFGDTGE